MPQIKHAASPAGSRLIARLSSLLKRSCSSLLVIWAATAPGLAAVMPHLKDRRPVEGGVHRLFAVLAALLTAQFLRADAADWPVVSVPAFCTLLVLGLALGANQFVRPAGVGLLYRGAVLAGWLGWWVVEFAPLTHGKAYILAVWGGTAAALLVGGAWRGRRPV